MSGKAGKPPSDFAAQLIAAIEDAQAAASRPLSEPLLAQAAWDKLQYDFPIVSRDELAALVNEFSGGNRDHITARFLAVLRESAGAPVGGAGQPGEPGTSGSADAAAAGGNGMLVPLYQQLYALAVVQSLTACLEAPEAAAAQQLAGLQLGGGAGQGGTQGSRLLEQQVAEREVQQAEQTSEDGQQWSAAGHDDDGKAYEPLESMHPSPTPQLQQQQASLGDAPAGSGGECATGFRVPLQLAELAGHLGYHAMAAADAWRSLRLMQRLASCLGAVRRHPRFLELEGVANPLLRLAADRMTAAPAELAAGLPPLLDALGVPAGSAPGSSSSGARKQDAAASALAAELAFAVAAALAAQVAAPSVRGQLWQVVQQRLLPLAGQQLEGQQVALARQARNGSGQPDPQQLYRLALPCQLVYFYVLQAPAAALQLGPGGAASRVHDTLQRGGLFRALVLLFVQLGQHPGAEPLRCALLLACAAAQPLADWAAAVPGFDAAVAAPALLPGGEAAVHGALWATLGGKGGTQLAALLDDAFPASKLPAVVRALQLMADLQAVSRRPQRLWDAAVGAALRRLAATLREHYKPRQEEEEAAGAAAAGSGDCQPEREGPGGPSEGSSSRGAEADGAEDARKLAVAPGEQAELLAMRRAQQLQPCCLKLVKDLLHSHAGSGGKHD